jgi:hypothetical protein
MQQMHVDRSAIRSVKIVDVPEIVLEPGQARLKVERLSLTANTLTYAVAGEAIGYWNFFPTEQEGWGIVPAWGFAVVTESAGPLEVGSRYYGFWPMATSVIVTPDRIQKIGFIDAAPHRASLLPVYNRYLTAPGEDIDDLRALLQPLLATSFLLDDFLSENNFFDAEQVIIGSASSKTGLGLARLLAVRRPDGPGVVGLTGTGNVKFCHDLGIYDQIIEYQKLSDEIVPNASVFVDMAGNTGIRRNLHTLLEDVLKHSCSVGLSHWDQFDPSPDPALPGIKPLFFFAPAWSEKRRTDWGAAELGKRVEASWRDAAGDSTNWMRVEHHQGIRSIPKVWADIADGKSRPSEGHIAILSE